MSGMTILVTGGAGFLGSNLCRRLVAEGHRVVALDNFQTGQGGNLDDLRGHARFELLEADVAEPFDHKVPAALDRVYHLACPASPPHYQRDPVRTMMTNVLGTLNALELTRQRGARLLLASTSEVYGDPEVHPQPEDYRGNVSPNGPRACYDEGKRAAEALAMDYHRTRQTDIRIARIFNTYGPGMAPDDGRVISNFITQALRGEALTIYGDGSQTRSLCYVDDLVDGLVRLMEQDRTLGPVNLGNPGEVTVRDIAQTILEVVGRGSLTTRPLPTDDPRRRCPDITRARALLGFEPRTSFRDGLPPTIAWFERALSQR